MRIATWNLERGGRTQAARPLQEKALRAVGADIVVLTEPPGTFKAGPGVVTSPPLRPGLRGHESWVAIVGPTVEPVAVDTPYGHLAVGARAVVDGRTVVICGAVLPWLSVRSHAADLVRSGEDFHQVFSRILEAQRSSILRLQASADLLVWAGDFNQSIEGPVRGCSVRGRIALKQCLADLGFIAWNAAAEHARPDLCAVDLICGPENQQVRRQGRIGTVWEADGTIMSDHAGYWVDL